MSTPTFDGTVTSGRKGIAYDWQTLLPEYHLSDESAVDLLLGDSEVVAA